MTSIIHTVSENISIPAYLDSLMVIIKQLDDIDPYQIYSWRPITGDVEHDGYPKCRDGYLMESLLRHLFCKRRF